MIDKQLNKAEAVELFNQNCVFHWGSDAVEEHRIAELFGSEIARKVAHHQLSMKPGEDWNAAGCSPCLHYYYLVGFLKIVSAHNYRLQVKAHAASEGGKIMDMLHKEWSDAIAAIDAEEERKAQERKAKRAAAQKAREQAQATA